MRIMQIAYTHDAYTRVLQVQNKRCATHAQCIKNFLDGGYWGGHVLTPALERLGHDVFLCIPRDDQSQILWCKEHDIQIPPSPEYRLFIAACQVAVFQPDVLYITIPQMMDDIFLSLLPQKPPLVIGWNACRLPPHIRWTGYDLFLSSHSMYLEGALDRGASRSARFFPGFPANMARGFPSGQLNDVAFSGYWTDQHVARNKFLSWLAQELPPKGYTAAYYISTFPDAPPLPPEISTINRGAIWGRSMLRAFSASRIVLNAYAELGNGPQSVSPNMRQMEATGMGAMLLTQASSNLRAFFTPGREVETFRDQKELMDKILFFLANEEERRTVAENGQRRCLNDFNMDMRALAFMDRVNELFHPMNIPPETLIRTLRHLAGTPISEELRQSALQLAIRGTDGERNAVLDYFDSVPASDIKNLNFAKALRAMAQNQNEEAESLLRKELGMYPWNDDARGALSSLIMDA